MLPVSERVSHSVLTNKQTWRKKFAPAAAIHPACPLATQGLAKVGSAYFQFMEILFSSHTQTLTGLETTRFLHIAHSLEEVPPSPIPWPLATPPCRMGSGGGCGPTPQRYRNRAPTHEKW